MEEERQWWSFYKKFGLPWTTQNMTYYQKAIVTLHSNFDIDEENGEDINLDKVSKDNEFENKLREAQERGLNKSFQNVEIEEANKEVENIVTTTKNVNIRKITDEQDHINEVISQIKQRNKE